MCVCGCVQLNKLQNARRKDRNKKSLTISWYLWNGANRRVPHSTLERRKDERGMDLINVVAKCHDLSLVKFLT